MKTMLTLALFAASAWLAAAPPYQMNYQGRLAQTGGVVAVADGAHKFIFTLYDAETGGTALWTETQSGVTTRNGLFSVVLGKSSPLSTLAFDRQYWLAVNPDDDGDMSPRMALTSAPYALQAASLALPVSATTMSTMDAFAVGNTGLGAAVSGKGAVGLRGQASQMNGVGVMAGSGGQSGAVAVSASGKSVLNGDTVVQGQSVGLSATTNAGWAGYFYGTQGILVQNEWGYGYKQVTLSDNTPAMSVTQLETGGDTPAIEGVAPHGEGGVRGQSETGYGLYGSSVSGDGVMAAAGVSGTALEAFQPVGGSIGYGAALKVRGRIETGPAGSGVCPVMPTSGTSVTAPTGATCGQIVFSAAVSNADSVVVTGPGLSVIDLKTVILVSFSGLAPYGQYVEVTAGGFIIHFQGMVNISAGAMINWQAINLK